MRTVWKFPLMDGELLRLNGYQVELPVGARIVHAEHQGDIGMCLWAEVDTEAEREAREFAVFGTGSEIPDGATHVHTWQAGPYVWHLYEVAS